MKKITIGFWVVAMLFAAPVHSDERNAFHEGTRFAPLTEQQKETLRVYVESARVRLTKAVETAKGKGFEAANAIYLSAIRVVVLESFKDQERSQLLMRMALNQALQLTFGIPTSDGKKVEEPGFLLGIANPELLTVILEESIQIALQYLLEDLKAIDAKKLLDLPYDKFAHSRLQLARKWLASALDQRGAYVLSVVSLAQWLTTMNQKEQLHSARYAEELDKVDTELNNAGVSVGAGGKIEFSVPQDPQALAGRVRVFRGTTRTLDEELQKKTSVKALDTVAPAVKQIVPQITKAQCNGMSDEELKSYLNVISKFSTGYEQNEYVEKIVQKFIQKINYNQFIELILGNLSENISWRYEGRFTYADTKLSVIASFYESHHEILPLNDVLSIITYIPNGFNKNQYVENYFEFKKSHLTKGELDKLLGGLSEDISWRYEGRYKCADTKDRILKAWLKYIQDK